MNWGDEEGLDSFFPGSKRKRSFRKERQTQTLTEMVEEEVEDFLGKPREYQVNGKDIKFYTIGQLAHALNRRPVTLRKWESEGIIPMAQFIAPSDTPNGRRRLYTREQVEGIIRIAEDEGILADTWKPIKKTRFTSRVISLFEELS